MAGKRSFKKVTFDRSEGDTVIKSISLPEGGNLGYFSVWQRKIAGTANAALATYSSFVSNPEPQEVLELTSGDVYETLNTNLWGWYAEFPYLNFVVNFSDSESPPPPEEGEEPPEIPFESATVELYIVSY